MKELLLTTLATTISIVLTFGTAHFVEQRQAEKSRRLMAQTIISDIDQSLNVIKNYIQEEENGRNITLYLIENINRLDNVSDDTLNLFFKYVTPSTFDIDMEFKKNNESIFNSSQDTWHTLDDKKFFSNVQDFYSYRAIFERQRKESAIFQKPVTAEELYQMLMNTDEMSSHRGRVETCHRLLKSIQVKRYIDLYAERVKNYQYFLMIFFNQNEENKFLMNITEQEMKDFANQTYRTVRPVKDKELVGTWEASYPNDNYQAIFEYKKDHTFTAHYALSWSDAAIIGKMIQRFSIEGTWVIEGDSLVKVFDTKSYKMEIDENGASYQPNQASAVEQLKKEMSKIPEGMTNRAVQATNIDESGTRLQLNEPGWNSTHYRKVQ
ncbi:MAG: hypothetical protein IJT30_07645 [Muribaculaceae bacterium]|nr:hypothetical protein [Muribaculaceae bacterium]